MRFMHNLRVYPPRVSMSVDMKTSSTTCLQYKIEGTDRDERLAGELMLPFNDGMKLK